MADANSSLPRRKFGRAGVEISALGLGGHHLGDPEDEKTALQIVSKALDGGITAIWTFGKSTSSCTGTIRT